MPLPFLTADSARDDRADVPDDPLPYAGREHWRRPYRPGPWRVAGAAVLLLIASFMLFSALAVVLFGSVAGAVASILVCLLVLAVALRLLRVGVWVGPSGLRQAGLCYTTTLPWSEVAAVRTVQRPVKWLGLPRTLQGQALVIVRRREGRPEGEPLRALLTDHGADFLARREGFERAADVIEAWAAEHGVAVGQSGPR
ncbi:hypothetical protein [Streptomyces sp. ODS28]|uniref:hypothetical protein n=1 Tax=Streptomyces sp. ODS28 TaxID=3136688 RepID=UPI0031ED3468